ncbi:unnamed protein product [Effrenium voratum]|nr:unnamed protein product [Effrenium voratum]
MWSDLVQGKPELEDTLSSNAKQMKADMYSKMFKESTVPRTAPVRLCRRRASGFPVPTCGCSVFVAIQETSSNEPSS